MPWQIASLLFFSSHPFCYLPTSHPLFSSSPLGFFTIITLPSPFKVVQSAYSTRIHTAALQRKFKVLMAFYTPACFATYIRQNAKNFFPAAKAPISAQQTLAIIRQLPQEYKYEYYSTVHLVEETILYSCRYITLTKEKYENESCFSPLVSLHKRGMCTVYCKIQCYIQYSVSGWSLWFGEIRETAIGKEFQPRTHTYMWRRRRRNGKKAARLGWGKRKEGRRKFHKIREE